MRIRFAAASFALMTVLACATAVRAAIPLGVVERFDSMPTNTSWSTRIIPGSGAMVSTAVQLDEIAQTNSAAGITQAVVFSTSLMPGGNPLAGWSSTGGFIYTRPVGVAAQCLMATIENTSSISLQSVIVRYSAGIPSSFAGEDLELIGHRVFFSLTGEPGSWTLVPELVTTSVMQRADGLAEAELALGEWLPGARLYLLWIDDNGGPGTDSLFKIDDFIVTLPGADPCQSLVLRRQPEGVTNLTRRTIQLTAPADGGFNLTYQWHKESFGPIGLQQNATANRSTLVITNAQMADSGNYFLVVSSPACSVTSLTARVLILHDDIPPRIIGVRLMQDSTSGVSTAFHIFFDEPLCENWEICGGDPTFPFDWDVTDMVEPWRTVIRPLAAYLVGGTNLVLPVDLDGRSPRTYILTYVGQGQTTDLGGYPLALDTTVFVYPTVFLNSNGTNHAGIEDTELEQEPAGGPDAPRGHLPSIRVDGQHGSGALQGLLQFTNLFGPAQVPPLALIRRAWIRLTVTESGNSVSLHRMLVPWSENTATWNGFSGGIRPGVNAEPLADALVETYGQPLPFVVEIDVTASVQRWGSWAGNFGWALLPTGGDGVQFNSSESASGPMLIVEFEPRNEECVPMILHDAPRSVALYEAETLYLAPGVAIYRGLEYQWFRNGIPLVGATQSWLIVSGREVCDAPARYQLGVMCWGIGPGVTSAPVTVSLKADIVRPILLAANGSLDGTSITLRFSKVLNRTNATNVANYTFTPSLPVNSATLNSNGTTVVLMTPPRGLVEYTLRIAGVTDNRTCEGGFPIDPDPTVVPITGVKPILPWASEWLYATNSQDATLAGVPWFAPGFVPGPDWQPGMALLGHELSAGTVAQFPTVLRTFIPPNTNTPPDFITTYYRRTIDLPPLPPGTTHALGHFIDDGAVFYLDGVEFARVNMPTNSPVLSSTRATTVGEASVQYLSLAATPGPHLLAVELHQAGSTTSSDNLFGAEIVALTSRPSLVMTNPYMSSTTWFADSSWQMVSSTNVAGPYLPWSSAPATNAARFFQMRFRGVP